jgi:hypothetical protein
MIRLDQHERGIPREVVDGKFPAHHLEAGVGRPQQLHQPPEVARGISLGAIERRAKIQKRPRAVRPQPGNGKGAFRRIRLHQLVGHCLLL